MGYALKTCTINFQQLAAPECPIGTLFSTVQRQPESGFGNVMFCQHGSHMGMGWNREVLNIVADRLGQHAGPWRPYGGPT